MPEWAGILKGHHELKLDSGIEDQLCRMGPSTIDRRSKQYRIGRKRRGGLSDHVNRCGYRNPVGISRGMGKGTTESRGSHSRYTAKVPFRDAGSGFG